MLTSILFTVLSTSPFVGGLTSAFLDNSIRGTREERGIQKKAGSDAESSSAYIDLNYKFIHFHELKCRENFYENIKNNITSTIKILKIGEI